MPKYLLGAFVLAMVALTGWGFYVWQSPPRTLPANVAYTHSGLEIQNSYNDLVFTKTGTNGTISSALQEARATDYKQQIIITTNIAEEDNLVRRLIAGGNDLTTQHGYKVRVSGELIEIIIYINPNIQMSQAELTKLINEYYVYGILDAASYLAHPETGTDPAIKELAQQTFDKMTNSNQFLIASNE